MLQYEPLTLSEAKALTERIRQSLTEYSDAIVEAFNRHADEALGYRSWEEYVQAEFPSLPRLDPSTRPALSRRLREAGMTIAQAQTTLGVSRNTIKRDTRRISDPTEDRTLSDRIAQAVDLARTGMSYRQIGPKVGLDESCVRRDPSVRAARAHADPDAHGTVLHHDRTIACQVVPVTDALWEVEFWLDTLLGPNYTLAKQDLNKLRVILTTRLEKVEGYGQ